MLVNVVTDRIRQQIAWRLAHCELSANIGRGNLELCDRMKQDTACQPGMQVCWRVALLLNQSGKNAVVRHVVMRAVRDHKMSKGNNISKTMPFWQGCHDIN